MPKRRQDIDFIDMSESGNWNVAADYVKLKIMRWLYFADEYEVIATFGVSDFIDEFQIEKEYIDLMRIKALQRLCKTLQMIINNTVFAVKKNDKPKLESYLKSLKQVEEMIPETKRTIKDQRENKTTVKIKEDYFNKVLDILIDLKARINEPLNRADLIFTSTEEFDPKKFKEALIEHLSTTG